MTVYEIAEELIKQRNRLDKAIDALLPPPVDMEPAPLDNKLSKGTPGVRLHWTQDPKNRRKLMRTVGSMQRAKAKKH